MQESFTDDTNFLFNFGSSDVAADQIDRPAGMAVDTFDRIFVADEKNHRIKVFNYFGDFLFTFGSSGSGDGQFDRPTGIAIDSSDRIIITDSRNDRIQVFDSDGTFLFTFGSSGSGDGQLNNPLGLTVNLLDIIYIADSDNSRIQVFDSDGTFLHVLGDPELLQNNSLFKEPVDLVIGDSDRFFVADQTSRVIHVLDSSGKHLELFSWTGDKYQSTAQPNGLVVDSTNRIIVSDIANDLILVFGDLTAETTHSNEQCLDCDLASVSVGQKNYQNSEYNFEIDYPANWKADETFSHVYEFGVNEESTAVISFFRSVPGMPYISVYHLENESNINSDDQQYLENLKSLSKKQCDNSFEIYGNDCVDYSVDAEIISLDGTKAYQVTHTWKEDFGEGLDIQRTSVVTDVIKDGTIWTIQSVNRAVDGNYYVPNDDILKSINSFSFTNNAETTLNGMGEKYINTDIGLEIHLPENWKTTPLYDPSDLDYNFSILTSKKIDNFELYSDTVLVMSIPYTTSSENDHLESIMIFITKKIPDTAFGLYQMSDDMISKSSIDSVSDTSNGGIDDICEDSLKIQDINDMKPLYLEFECGQVLHYDSIFFSIFLFD